MGQVLGRVVCLVRGHRWRVAHDRDTQGTDATCLRCGAHRVTFPGGESTRQREQGDGTNFRGPVGGWDA